ncbi:unnamed protein product [Paramecium sonneborni]|uniref:Uncharacterized protein n=1 Tax=Paramecium sonneborni TaxID=65129 RepID=A0A8S1QV72_9CILI|nr:unnamed protein product [Paramecium sonneborni]
MDLENQNQAAFLDSKDMVEKLEKLEITSESFDSKMACIQYFSYILTWDIVNARFFFYKYQRLLESDQLGIEMTKFLKLVFENKHSELIKGCDKLCEILNTQQVYKKWIEELKNRVQEHLKDLIEKNFQSISAVRLSSFGINPQGKAYVKVEEKQQANTPLNIEKLSQIARLIQNMENK